MRYCDKVYIQAAGIEGVISRTPVKGGFVVQYGDKVSIWVGDDVVGITTILAEEAYTTAPLWPFCQEKEGYFVPSYNPDQKRIVVASSFPLLEGGHTLKRFYLSTRGDYRAGIVRHPRRREGSRYSRDQWATLRAWEPADDTKLLEYHRKLNLQQEKREQEIVTAQLATFSWVAKNPIIALTGLAAWKVRMILKIVER